MKYSVLLLFPAFVMLSCVSNNSNNNKSQQEENILTSPLGGQKMSSHNAPAFYKRYEGTIAGQPVIMYLEKDDKNYLGYYYYVKVGKPINISGETSRDTDSLNLTENDAAEFNDENSSSFLLCKYFGEDLKGKWTNGKKEYEIILKESHLDGSYSFELKKYTDSAKVFVTGKNSPQATSFHKIPMPVGNSEEINWLNGQIKSIVKKGRERKSIDEIIKEVNDTFFANYKKEIQEEAKLYKESEYPASWNYDETLNCSLRYNEKGIVVIEAMGYSYMGGAHGNYGSNFYNYDVTNKKLLQLKDVVDMDSSSLQRLLQQQFRKDYKISPKTPLTDILFDDYLATTDNFYVTDKGLGFLYNPYEVASYAQGQIDVFLPYTLLIKYINPDFKKRIQL